MRPNRTHRIVSPTAVLSLLVLAPVFAADARAVTIAWSPVGNAGNTADTTVMYTDATSGYGSVTYNYRIGTYDVTASQYAELNAKDPNGTNALFLYNSKMSTSTYGNINLDAGSLPSSKYTPVMGRENLPVNFVSWYDTIRFANWLNNGQGNGDTETGAYTLGTLGAGGVPVTPPLTHHTGSQIWLPTEDEWYKAAYYDPRTTAQGGPPSDSHYWLYPTSSNTLPTASSPTALPNRANYLPGGPGDLTDVGAYTSTTSPYGAFDMGGNVWQWNETLLSDSQRVFRGGSWSQASGDLLSSSRFGPNPSDEGNYFGFRVATVPEPSTLVLLAIGVAGLFLSRRSRKWLLSVVCLLGGARSAQAAQSTWVGGDMFPVGLWSQPGNWSGGIPVSDPTTGLIFAVDVFHGGLTIQNLADPFKLEYLSFTGQSFVLQGNALRFSALSQMSESTSASVLISAPITMDGDLYLIGSGGGTVILSGPIADGVSSAGLWVTTSSTFVLSGNNSYSGDTVIHEGTLTVESGGTLGATTGSLFLLAVGGVGSTVNLNSSQTVGRLGGSESGGFHARLNLNGSGTTLTVNQSTADVFEGVIAGAGKLVEFGNCLYLSRANTYSGGTTIYGTVIVANTTGSGLGSGDINITNNGVLANSAVGSVAGNVVSDGFVAPGYVKGFVPGLGTFSGPGVFTMHGNYSQTASAGLEIEIGGRTVGSQYDRLIVDGVAALAGSLDVTLINSFPPALGDRFTVLSYLSHSGVFGAYTGLALGGHLAFKPQYSTSELVLKVLPAINGDINLDGKVNIFDINAVSSNWNTAGPQGDANDDGAVNIFDINLISSNWGATGSALAVPEPSTLVLAVLSVIGLLVGRRPRTWLVSALCMLCAGVRANAATSTWIGADSLPAGLWSQPLNWTGGVPASAVTTDLVFAADVFHGGVTLQNIGNPFDLNSLEFTGQTFILQGNSLSFRSDSPQRPEIKQSTSAPQLIAVPITMANGVIALTGAGTGIVTLAAPISDGPSTSTLFVESSTFALSGNNTYTGGTQVFGGTLTVNPGGTLGATTGYLYVATQNGIDSTLNLNTGGSVTAGYLAGSASPGLHATINLNDTTLQLGQSLTSTYSGVLAGNGGLAIDGKATLVLEGANTYRGGTAVLGGTLTVNPGGTLGLAAFLNVHAFNRDTTLNLNTGGNVIVGTLGGNAAPGFHNTINLNGATTLIVGQTGSTTYSGLLAGTGGFTKSGFGTLTLLGANTYTGGTQINAGVLAIDGSIAGDTTVDFDSTLQGTGSVGGLVMVKFAGTISPGNSVGTFAVDRLSLLTGSQMKIELGGTQPGVGYDTLSVNGLADLGGTFSVFKINGFQPTLNEVFSVLSFGSRTGDFATYSGLDVGGHLSLQHAFTASSLLLTARPTINGDINLDGTVNIFDINSVSTNWGMPGPQGDANGDGIVDIFDINLISANWTPTGGSVSVSEPSTLFLTLCGLVGFFVLQRKHSSRQ